MSLLGELYSLELKSFEGLKKMLFYFEFSAESPLSDIKMSQPYGCTGADFSGALTFNYLSFLIEPTPTWV